jgi:hypothetical protein
MVATGQARPLLDISLRKLLLFPQLPQTVADDYGGPFFARLPAQLVKIGKSFEGSFKIASI